MDLLLLSYIHSTEESERERLLSELILVHAAPLVRHTLRRKLGLYVNQLGVNPHNQDAEDLYHEVMAKLIGVLNEPKLSSGQIAINNFRQYVLRLAINACHDHLRAKSPARTRLKNNLRDLLERHQDFALWHVAGNKTLCGFAVWIHEYECVAYSRVSELLEQPRVFLSAKFSREDIRQVPLTKIVAELFKWLDCPTELDDIVNIVAALLNIRDQPHYSLDDDDNRHWVESIPAPDFCCESQTEAQYLLRLIWEEARRLPSQQRDTFCLSFADDSGDDLFTLLVAVEITTLEQLAQEFDRPLDELMRLWQHMPMDNETLAHELRATRQQVNKWRFRALLRLKRELLPSMVEK